MEKQKLIFTFLIINLLVLNLAFVYLYFKPQPPPSLSSSTPGQSELQAKIDQLKTDLLAIQDQLATSSAASPASAPTSSPVSVVSSPQTSYIPVPGSGSLLAYQWTKLAGTEFYFNPADFPNLSKAYFEANMRLLNGNGLAFLRLFDLTAGIEIWGSEIQTANQADTVVVSDPLQFRTGNHLICVQAKSLTADTTVFTSGRLKIISH